MRIFRRQEFLKLPAGTIFAKCRPWVFGEMSVKGESTENDFIALCFSDIESNDMGEWLDRLDEMLATGCSYPMDNDGWTRDGMFDESDLFLVFELADLTALSARVTQAIAVARNTAK